MSHPATFIEPYMARDNQSCHPPIKAFEGKPEPFASLEGKLREGSAVASSKSRFFGLCPQNDREKFGHAHAYVSIDNRPTFEAAA